MPSIHPSLVLALAVLPSACGDGPPTQPEGMGIDPRWSVGVPLPFGLTSAAAVEFDGSIYVAGGDTEAGGSRAVFRYTPGATSWERLEDLPDNRVSGQLVVAAGALFLVGGMERLPGNAYMRSLRVFRYAPHEGRWVERASVPDHRDGIAASVPGAIVVVGGGFGHPDHGGVFPGDSAAVYDVAANRWAYAAPIGAPRYGPMAVAFGPEVHVFGGRRVAGDGTAAEIEIYDAVSDTWRAGGTLLPAYNQVGGQTFVRVGDHVHFLGGFVVPGGSLIEMHSRYDTSTGEWDILPSLPTPRSQAAAVAVGNRIYVIGGRRAPRIAGGALLNAVLIYDAGPKP